MVESPTLGEGWLRTSRAILERGALERYDDQPRACALDARGRAAVLGDPRIAELGDTESRA